MEAPTPKQIAYAKKLSYRYGVACPVFATKADASKWISTVRKGDAVTGRDTYNLTRGRSARW